MDIFSHAIPITDAEIVKALDHATAQVLANLPKFTHAFKYSHSEDNFYTPSENVEWTTGFWTGEIWLAYEYSQNTLLKEAGLIQVESFMERILHKIDVEHHDMGFLYSPSCVAAYKLVGNEQGKKAALLAADNLISRFQEKGQFIQAWGKLGAKDNYRLIIDCLLNLPLLFWATETTSDEKYRSTALKHIKTSMQYVLRDDDSTYHTYYFDPTTGLPVKGVTAQGHKDGSAWARGQAWGIYGVALAYRYTKDEAYLQQFIRITKYFLDHLPEDLLPYWDFDFTTGSSEPRDSSSSAIAICGMLEMAKYLPKDEADFYIEVAKKLLRVLMKQCAVTSPKISNGQLLHGTYARESPYNTCNNRGVDECLTWGDYYYVEALLRVYKKWDPYW